MKREKLNKMRAYSAVRSAFALLIVLMCAPVGARNVSETALLQKYVQQLGPASLPFLVNVLMPLLQVDSRFKNTLAFLVNSRHQSRVESSTTKPMLMSSLLLPPIGGFHSQCGQDWLVHSFFADSANDNFYVDLAANDAVRISNTYALDRIYNWRGICIEANPQYWYGLAMHRTCRLVGAAVGDRNGLQVPFVFSGVMGGIVGDSFDNKPAKVGAAERQNVSTLSLETIFAELEAPRRIQYLSLDVEGAEWLVSAVVAPF